jgi:hypothetical protein
MATKRRDFVQLPPPKKNAPRVKIEPVRERTKPVGPGLRVKGASERPFQRPEHTEAMKREARATQETLVQDKSDTDKKIEELRPTIAAMEEFQASQRPGNLTVDEQVIILEAHFTKGIGPNAIAKVLNRPHSTIVRFLQRYKSTAPIAKQLLTSKAADLAKRVVDNANVQESLEVLDRLDVLPRKNRGDGSASGPRFNIFVGSGAAGTVPPVPTQDVIDAEAVRVTAAKSVGPKVPALPPGDE